LHRFDELLSGNNAELPHNAERIHKSSVLYEFTTSDSVYADSRHNNLLLCWGNTLKRSFLSTAGAESNDNLVPFGNSKISLGREFQETSQSPH
jgi:hypothetical protein